MVAHYGKSALEQRLYPISSNRDASPANVSVDAILVNKERLTLVYLVVLPLHFLRMPDIAQLVDEFDIRIMVENVMIRFKFQPDMFCAFV